MCECPQTPEVEALLLVRLSPTNGRSANCAAECHATERPEIRRPVFPASTLESLLSGLSGGYDLSLYRRGARAPVAKCTTLMPLTTALSEGGARGLLWHRLDRMLHSRHHLDLRVAWRFRSFRHCGVTYWRICLA